MSGKSDSRVAPGRIDAAAKAGFLEALRAGARRDEAAKAAGFSCEAFYQARKRDPAFRLGWIYALEASAAEEREQRRASTLLALGDDERVEIAPNNQRILQRRTVRHTRFTDKRKKRFFDVFAGTADLFAAAEAAGVHVSTVYRHLRIDPEFTAACDEALAVAVASLEAEAVRQRLEAQARLRENLEPAGEMAQEFERVMKLLARYDRRDGRVARREVGRGQQRRWTFEEAIGALDKRLRALGLRHGIADNGEPDECEPDRAE
jgi:hypothetical protein